MEEKVYPLVPEEWHSDLRLFTEDELRNVAFVNGAAVHAATAVMDESYNADEFNPRDGELVKAVDDLAAFMEAYLARENGISSPELERAMNAIGLKYSAGAVAGVDLTPLCKWFSGSGDHTPAEGVTASPVLGT
jgi:putative hydrolase of HD superfamily